MTLKAAETAPSSAAGAPWGFWSVATERLRPPKDPKDPEDKEHNPEDLEKKEAQQDEWLREGATVVRHHHKPRLRLFTPLRVAGAPPAKALTGARVTEGSFADGRPFRCIDQWTSRDRAHLPLGEAWTGKTTFLIREHGICS